MKKIKFLIIGTMIICCGLVSTAFKNHKQLKEDKKSAQEKGFAVVELFTSEGCSSCPAADEVVAKLQQALANKPVFVLAFHVDYWNHLGWKDVFSSADYSHRQRAYAQWLNLQSVYTPQIVVNGTTEFVGSDKTKLENAIKSDLQMTEKNQVTLNGFKTANGQTTFGYTVENPMQNISVFLAIVQKSAQTKVRAGENGGRTLSHVQIVRTFKNVPLNGKNIGVAQLDLPKDVDIKNLEVVAFLQNTSNGNIIAATKSALD